MIHLTGRKEESLQLKGRTRQKGFLPLLPEERIMQEGGSLAGPISLWSWIPLTPAQPLTGRGTGRRGGGYVSY